MNTTVLTRPPSFLLRPSSFPSICPLFTEMSRRHSSFAPRASSHSTLPLGKSVQANISRSLMLNVSDSGRYTAGRERPPPPPPLTKYQGPLSFPRCCFYPIKQETSVIGTQRCVTHSLGLSSYSERTQGGGTAAGLRCRTKRRL